MERFNGSAEETRKALDYFRYEVKKAGFHNTPTSFTTMLYKAKNYADKHPDLPKLITINAWNECV